MEEEKSAKSGCKYTIRPFALKVQAVEELRSGSLTRSQLAAKYGVQHSTIINWERQVELKEVGADPLESSEEMKRIANEVLDGIYSIEEAAEEYRLTKPVRLRYWVERVRKENWQLSKQGLLPKPDIALMSKRKKKSESEEMKQLRESLQTAQMRVVALEKLIEVAERDLGIKIKKKSGTRQSKK